LICKKSISKVNLFVNKEFTKFQKNFRSKQDSDMKRIEGIDNMQRKEILIFNPYAIWSYHLAIDLEIIKKHLDAGDSITVLTCNEDLSSCIINPLHDLLTCQICIAGRTQGFKLLGFTNDVKFLNVVSLSQNDEQLLATFPKYVSNLRELKSLNIESFDIGLCVAGDLITYLREPYPNPKKHKEFVKNNIESSLKIYLSIKNHIRKIKPDKIYVFNGRFGAVRPVIRAAQLLSVDFDVHERAQVQGKYSLVNGTYPHDLSIVKSVITSSWANSNLKETDKIEMASQWFTERKSGKDQAWYSFTQSQNEIPDFINKDKINVIIFNSSQDEFETIEGWENHLYKSQNQGIFKLAHALQNDKSIDVYLRIHPNLRHVDNSQTKPLSRLKNRYQNFHIIDADSPVNSYELMDIADCIITFGSTMGIEAAFFKKPSLLVGRSSYEHLDACTIIQSHQELLDVIMNKKFGLPDEIKDRRKYNASKYGFYMKTDGINLEIFKQDGVNRMIFKDGKSLDEFPSQLQIILYQVQQTQSQLQQTQDEHQKLQVEYHNLTQLAQQALIELSSVKSSKFWRMRQVWFKLKEVFRLTIKKQIR